MIYIYAAALVIVSFFYLFVCVNEHGDGCMAKTKVLVTVKFPDKLRAGAEKICGKCFVNAIDRTVHYICNERNPIVQCMYFFCDFGGFYVYVTEGFQYMPNKYM